MLSGGCRCGAVRYTIALDEATPIYACHCTRCQRASGSAFAMQLPVRETLLTVEGPLTEAATRGESGALSVSRFCATCLSRIYSTNERWPGMAIVRAGTLDRSELLAPAMHIFTSTKQPWVMLPEGVPAYAESASPEQFAAVLRGGA